MKIYDISQEVFGSKVYPGDDVPKKNEVMRMEQGDAYNLTSFSMCAHNGTHIDAPFHFLKQGKTVEQIDLNKVIGMAYVTEWNGEVSAQNARQIVDEAKGITRILLKGNAIVTCDAANVFVQTGIDLVGVELLSVGPEDAPKEVHEILLQAEVVLLEGIRLERVSKGCYFLNAAPLSLAGADGAPCRAVLIEME